VYAKSKNISRAESPFKVNNDTVVIDTEREFKFTKHELQELYKREPVFQESEYPDAPETAYNDRKTHDFNSELGKDIYYTLYAYFLSKSHSSKKHTVRRQKLIRIYRDINYIFGGLAQGGTYFGHQHTRILGDAEYSLCLGDFYDCYDERTYNITKQKKLYLSALDQQITDELSTSYDFAENEKSKLKKELSNKVKELDNLITDYFYLERTRAFQYSNY